MSSLPVMRCSSCVHHFWKGSDRNTSPNGDASTTVTPPAAFFDLVEVEAGADDAAVEAGVFVEPLFSFVCLCGWTGAGALLLFAVLGVVLDGNIPEDEETGRSQNIDSVSFPYNTEAGPDED